MAITTHKRHRRKYDRHQSNTATLNTTTTVIRNNNNDPDNAAFCVISRQDVARASPSMNSGISLPSVSVTSNQGKSHHRSLTSIHSTSQQILLAGIAANWVVTLNSSGKSSATSIVGKGRFREGRMLIGVLPSLLVQVDLVCDREFSGEEE